jgi:hypothetical protein
MMVPEGFSINSFAPSRGWHRNVQQHLAANGGLLETVTWTGGDIPTGEDSLFQFLGAPAGDGTYKFNIEQTYSNGTTDNWTGPTPSTTPAPTLQATSSLAGAGTSLLTIVALILGAIAVVLGGIALLTNTNTRPLA